MMITAMCPYCERLTELDVPDAGYKAWMDGELIQDALPMLTDSEREVLLTGICPTCWDELEGGVRMTDRIIIDIATCERTLSEVMALIRGWQRVLPDHEIFMDGDAYAIVARKRVGA